MSKCSVLMILKSKERYWTLLRPKYCAETLGGASAPAAVRASRTSAKRRIIRVPLALDRVGRSIAPQPLELIELARRRMEDVDHEIDIVEQHPVAAAQALHMTRP